MSTSQHPNNPWPHNQYTGQRADGRATQIVGNVGAVYTNPPGDPVQECLSALWLTNPSLTDPLDDRKSLIDKKGQRVSGTCEWIRKNMTYLSWLRSRSQLLWLSGGPGKGKTMLSIFLAEELEQTARESQDAIFIQYFCDNKDERRNTAVTVVRALVFQLLQKRKGLITHILPTFKIQKESLFTESSSWTLWGCFESMVRDTSLGVVYCLVDGLDECKEASLDFFLKRLRALFSPNENLPSSCRLNLIAVSREQPDFVERELSGFPRIRLGPDADSDIDSDVKTDISKFITAKVDELSNYWKYPPQLRTNVEAIFHERAEGTFLWVGIVAKELEKCTCDEVKDALDRFPLGLDELYGRILLQIPSKRRETTAKILRWVVMAVRPLTLSELSAVTGNTDEAFSGLDRERVTLDQIRNCGQLLTTTDIETERKVGLIHQSFKDYMLRETLDPNPELESFRIKKEAANSQITKQCLDYVQNSPLTSRGIYLHKDQPCPTAFPLLSYAVLHWTSHARYLSDPNLDIFDLSLPFWADRSPIRDSWLRCYLATRGLRPLDKFPLLHMASDFELVPLAEKLLCGNRSQKYLRSNINKKDCIGRTALHLATQRESEALMQLLIKKGANIEAKDNHGRTALHSAAKSQNKMIMQLLIEKGADLEAKDRYDQTALCLTAIYGKEMMMQLLIERGADLNAKGEYGQTALHLAVQNENEMIVQLLIKKGADLDIKNKAGKTALHSAIQYRKETTVKLLIEKGADLEAKDKDGQTALRLAAAYWRNETMVQLLIEKGADLEAKDQNRRTVLHFAAAYWGNETMVQLLIEKGADLEAKDKDGWTALHSAIQYRKETTVKLLIEKGADLEAKDQNGRTALHLAAAYWGNETMVQLLIEKGADLEAKDQNRRTALHFAAAYWGNETMVQLLIEKGADLEAKDKYGWTALHLAATYRGKETMAQLLVEKGADLEAKDKDGQTALHLAATHGGKETMAQLLIEKGADLEVKDKDGRTALHSAAYWGNETMVQLLIEKGADLKAKDKDGRTALHLAATHGGKETMAQLLIEKGADLEAKDKDGRTALYSAAYWGRETIAQLLIEKGADLEAKDKDGWTALHLAAQNGDERIVPLLIEEGADLEAKDKYGRTAMELATRHKKGGVLRFLRDAML